MLLQWGKTDKRGAISFVYNLFFCPVSIKMFTPSFMNGQVDIVFDQTTTYTQYSATISNLPYI